MNKFWKITGAAALLLTACSDSSDNGSPIAPKDSSPSIVESSSAITGTESSSATIEQSSSSAADSAMVSDKSSSSQATSDGSVVKDGEITDLRDGKVYKTTTIGNQVWLAQNLTLDVMELIENGTYSTEDFSSSNLYTPLYQVYEEYMGDESNPPSFNTSNFYYWMIAIDSAGVYSTNATECAQTGDCSGKGFIRGICPEGFHIPDSTEVEQLYRAVGGKCNAGKDLRTTDWPQITSYGNKSEEATNKYGFSARPDGYFAYAWWEGLVPDHEKEPPAIFFTNKFGVLWGIDNETATRVHDGYHHAFFYDETRINPAYFFTVRCLRDEPAGVDWVDPPDPTSPAAFEFEYGEFTDERDGKTYQTVVVNGKTWMNQNLAYAMDVVDSNSACELTKRLTCNDSFNFSCEHPLIGGRVDCNYKYKIDSTYCKENEDVCKAFGKYYTWEQAKKACPAGWHLPSEEESDNFWDSPNPYTKYQGDCFTPVTDFEKLNPYGDNALVSEDLGKHETSVFWTSTESKDRPGYIITTGYTMASRNLANVRCVKD